MQKPSSPLKDESTGCSARQRTAEVGRDLEAHPAVSPPVGCLPPNRSRGGGVARGGRRRRGCGERRGEGEGGAAPARGGTRVGTAAGGGSGPQRACPARVSGGVPLGPWGGAEGTLRVRPGAGAACRAAGLNSPKAERGPGGRPGGSPAPCGFPPEPRRPPSVLRGGAWGRGGCPGAPRGPGCGCSPQRWVPRCALRWSLRVSLRVSLRPALTFTPQHVRSSFCRACRNWGRHSGSTARLCPQQCASREHSEADVSCPSPEHLSAEGRLLSFCPTPLCLSQRLEGYWRILSSLAFPSSPF